MGDTPQRNIRWLPVKNVTNPPETIPGFALMAVSGGSVLSGQHVFEVTKHNSGIANDANQHPALMMFNGPTPIPKEGYGQGTRDCPARALIEYDEFAAGLEWGAEDDSWYLVPVVGGPFLGMMLDTATVPLGDSESLLWVAANRSPGGYRFLNGSGETMPANGIGRVTAFTEDATNGDYYTIGKPNTTFDRMYLINNDSAVGNGEYGVGYFFEQRAAAYRSASGTPAVGESWGPKNGQWTLEKNYYGFTIMGGLDASAVTVRVQQHEVNEIIGKTDASHAKSASGTISVYAGTLGSEADTGCNVTAYNRFADIDSDKWVNCCWIGGGWDLAAAECA